MEDEIKNREINDTQYKEVEINKMIINGKEQAGNIINAEDTRGKQEINVTVYTRSMPQVQKDGGRNNRFYELLQKVLFHNKRS
ncbi:hypothetical protein [Lacrimispora saccharolytica]|uniref:Uncharacterized protein n=1 Tax=Lacrimispora saccharolytica (strain ATCC 35040 / DSM 2544 / NRCC 2533 / WM1) TaxID=610130 RepID=D9R713_LACSW|nr:hypothetical protein [Lacrimispora saccharolytica]ADL05445.1 hypothetical protein Closa_2909 [[Clostridium] saccharolyticum WM1]QRV20392.1 hypothetical protein I6K70_02235 [Lacrimispora saccharolytica]